MCESVLKAVHIPSLFTLKNKIKNVSSCVTHWHKCKHWLFLKVKAYIYELSYDVFPVFVLFCFYWISILFSRHAGDEWLVTGEEMSEYSPHVGIVSRHRACFKQVISRCTCCSLI